MRYYPPYTYLHNGYEPVAQTDKLFPADVMEDKFHLSSYTKEEQARIKGKHKELANKAGPENFPSEKNIRKFIKSIENGRGRNEGPADDLRSELDKRADKHINAHGFSAGAAKEWKSGFDGLDEAAQEIVTENIKGGFFNNLVLRSVGCCWLWATPESMRHNDGWNCFKFSWLAILCGMYAMCVAFIMSVQMGINACKDGLILQRENQSYGYSCQDINIYCKYECLGSDYTITSYVSTRLASYILALIPLAFSAYASQRHMKNTLNQLMDTEDEKFNKYLQAGKIDIRDKVKNFGATCNKNFLEKVSLFLFFCIYVCMGIVMFAMDIQTVDWFNKGDQTKVNECRKRFGDSSTYVKFLHPTTMNPEILSYVLLSFNSLYVLLSVIYFCISACYLSDDRVEARSLHKTMMGRLHDNGGHNGGHSGGKPTSGGRRRDDLYLNTHVDALYPPADREYFSQHGYHRQTTNP